MGYWMHRLYQMYSVIAMFLSPEAIAAQHICITIVSIFHVVPISLSMAFSVLIGNTIGAKRLRETRAYMRLGLALGCLWGLGCASVMLLFR